MKAIVVYDSVKGNTEKIAKSMGQGISEDTRVVRASEMTPQQLSGIELMIIGSPTYGGRPTETMQDLLRRFTAENVKGLKIASFDTRLPSRFVRIFGFAADKIASDLTGKGAVAVSAPEGFFVLGRDGPLKEGEEGRASAWAKRLTS